MVLLLDKDYRDNAWEGLAIARWLETLGNDLSATSENGRTLMRTAIEADDPEFVRFLLTRKHDPTTADPRRLVEFSVRHGEDMALTLLEAQLARRPDGWELPSDYRYVAELQDWPRVIAWLDAHPEVTHRDPSAPCRRVAQAPASAEMRKTAAATCGSAPGAGN